MQNRQLNFASKSILLLTLATARLNQGQNKNKFGLISQFSWIFRLIWARRDLRKHKTGMFLMAL